jgi:hypothetical protein
VSEAALSIDDEMADGGAAQAASVARLTRAIRDAIAGG